MGVLKNLTDEYFEKKIRTEDGKPFNVMGCDVIIPIDYDEEMFLDTIKDFMEILSSRTVQNINFVEEEHFDEDSSGETVQMKCGNGVYLEIETTYERLSELWRKNFPKREMNEKLYESIIKFLRFISKDVEIIFYEEDGTSNILLATCDEFEDKFLDYFSKEDYDGINECKDELTNMFFDEFESKAHIIRSEFDYFPSESDGGEFVAMRIFNFDDVFQFNTFLYAKEMRQWWKDTLDKIEEEGVVNFFNLDGEGEEK